MMGNRHRAFTELREPTIEGLFGIVIAAHELAAAFGTWGSVRNVVKSSLNTEEHLASGQALSCAPTKVSDNMSR